MHMHAGGSTEFQMRAHYIKASHKHVFEPMMKRCLDERPSVRGTFEDITEELQIHLKKYSKNKQAESLEEKTVRLLYLICTLA